jgi:DNA modification methylase/DNA-directed RNA polymerase subunit RPC12/RpoP
MSNKDPMLFLDDEFEETSLNPEPVVCLGMEFPCEEARRDYFREELRKKLPELKKIEGFPIGEDDDIVNLSDPPYFTACPNPWLNDFIREWEKEKEELEAAGKRNTRFEVKEPYAADVSEGKNNPIYMAHAYHTKVPHPAIMRYILHYTQPGDIVFDGFAGTGMTGVAAQLCGSKEDVEALGVKNAKVGVRKAICSDLSPIASLIAASYNLKFDVQSFAKRAKAILNQVEDELGWMYETEVDEKKAKINYTIWSDVFICASCGQEMTLWNEAVNLQEKQIKDTFPCPHCGATCSKKNMDKAWETSYDSLLNQTVTMNKKVPVRVNYTCNGSRGERDVVQSDLELLNRIDKIIISHLSTKELQEGYNTAQPINSNGITHTHQFYSKRNFIYLSRVLELAKGDIFLQTWLTSVLQRTTKSYKFTLDRKFGILTGTLYVPSLNVELNPINILNRKIKDISAMEYLTRGNAIVSINSATELHSLSDASIDYIFTDPPFGANIMYSELSCIWEAWIKVATNTKEEAIINNVQQKSLFEYQTLMNRSFTEYYRVLKPGKWITIEFSNTSASVWNSIQNALQGVGFIVVNVAALDKKQGSFKAVTTTTAVKQDLVITCYKPSNELTFKLEDSLDKSANAMDFIEELLVHLPIHQEKDNSTTAVVERSPKILYDRLISYYVRHGYAIPMDAQEFQKSLRERFIERDGMFFTASQALEYEDKKSKTTGIVPMALFIGSEAEGIEWLKRELKTPQTYSELQPEWMKNMTSTKKGDVLPELSEILEDNFIRDADGKWRKPDAEKAADMEIMRGRKMMKEYNMYLEQAQKPKARRMRDTRLEVLRYGFKECYKQKDYQAIITVGDHIQESLLQEDEILLQYYDIAVSRV